MFAAVRQAGGLQPPATAAVGRVVAQPGKRPPPAQTIGETDIWSTADIGGATAFFGRIDNRADIADAIGMFPAVGDASLYDAALARWGDAADRRVIGHYCAITITGPQQARLVRSPWTAPPLHFQARPDFLAASPLLAALFAAGVHKRVDWDYLADQLAYDHRDCEPAGWYAGIGRVPLGCRVHVDGANWTLNRYYDPTDLEPVVLGSDDAYVERAMQLLDEAARAALAGIEQPALMLSGGLDSPLAAAALIRQLPKDRVLHSYTFGPGEDWDGWEPPNRFGDERGRVRRFADLHPQLHTHFPPPDGGHDHRLRELLAVSEVPTANIANIGIFHPLFEAAKADGCDAMLTALHGNFTISLDAPWAAAEALRHGKLAAVWKILQEEGAQEEHSLLRRMLATAILPQLPDEAQRWIRRFVHPERFAEVPLGSLLSSEAASDWRARAKQRGSASVFDRPPIPASRSDAIRVMWASADSGEDLDLGMERLHGLAHRDVTAYRPLFEFCLALPTDQLRRGGIDRYLARRMARGIMPEEQRRDVRQGRHNVDWHARLTARREDLAAQAEAIRAHPQLSRLLDLDRMQRLLADWPHRTPDAADERLPREMGITRALTAAIFVSHAEKRNDF